MRLFADNFDSIVCPMMGKLNRAKMAFGTSTNGRPYPNKAPSINSRSMSRLHA